MSRYYHSFYVINVMIGLMVFMFIYLGLCLFTGKKIKVAEDKKIIS